MTQVQWCLSLLTLVNTMFLVLGTPTWIKWLYGWFAVFTVIWIVYYFKRGRRAELTNVVQDNPIYDEVKAARRDLAELREELSAKEFS